MAANLAKLSLKYGPIVYTLAQKYGPQVVEQMLKQREPAQRLVSARREHASARKLAFAHAESVVDGTVQQVFHADGSYWVVFSRNEPVGTHPHTNIPFEALLLNTDPGRRMRPEQLRRTVHLPKLPKR
ncbi:MULTISPECIES: hypothetical protein [unclassified Ornithinimicrobium]|uniref:hypothetical protein n=1 Tax=unclassified Ornithinimicrobium TaxID=2615080 RepID=UPI003853505D